MIDNEKGNWPPPLCRKILITVLIGLGCLLFGVAYFMSARDSVLLMLSIIVFIVSTIKGIGLYRIVKCHKYEVIEGMCTSVSGSPFSRYRKVKVEDDDGVETSLRINKNVRVQLKLRYKFYFTRLPANDFNSEYLNAALASDSFLGFERVSNS